ncbi:MAG: hypothetical protein P4K86_10625 [Terracidiphilus sp.]|nr:hypothetical protein [Terracidiphilus sp.]MDR3776076.1 hypothetical protein [Terracidiphilus sp.]
MPTHNPNEPEKNEPEQEPIDASKGFEQSDVRVTGILVFLTALSIFVVVTAVLSYGIGKVINANMAKEDGPRTKWASPVDVRPLGNLPANPELQSKVAELTQRFPTPRLQTDDGNQDIADLHTREDLLLDHYSWVDRSQGKVRIPIERAMELLAQRGLPQAPAVQKAPLMTGDQELTIAVPLTKGFARTGYELDQAAAQAAENKRPESHK